MGSSARAHLLVTLGVVATFLRALPYPLQRSWDDGRFIVDNPLVREVSLRALGDIFSQTHLQAYHPLHLLSYWLDVPWSNADATLLHATNLLLWAVTANVALRVFLGFGLALEPATLATLVYALHPIQVEAVSWATGRKDVLAALFALGACAFHLRSKTWGDRHAWFARASFACAALSKTTVLPLPAVLWLADVLLRGVRPRRALAAQLPSVAVALGLAPIAIATWQGHEMIRAAPGGVAGVASAAMRIANTLSHQLATTLWPHALSPMYSTRAVADATPGAWFAVGSFALAVALAARARARRALFATLAFLALLSPVCNAIPMVFPWQDRYLSLPLFPLAFGFGALFDGSGRATPRAAASSTAVLLGAAVVLTLVARSVQYQGAWSSEPRLWGHAASTQPDAYYAWMKLGEVRRDQGDLDGAVRAYTRLLELEPAYKLGYAALCQAVALRDEHIRHLAPSRAEAYAHELYAVLDDADALRALGGRMLATGHLRTLELPLARALDLSPFPDVALEQAARMHFRAGRDSVALFYLGRMRSPPKQPEVMSSARAAPSAASGAPTLRPRSPSARSTGRAHGTVARE